MQHYTGEERSLKFRGINLSWKKLLISILFAGFLFAWSIGFTEKLVDLYQVSISLEQIQHQEQELQREIALLQEEKEYLDETWYIEMQARNRLNLVMPGEVIIKQIEPE